jgi:hypothetical protein
MKIISRVKILGYAYFVYSCLYFSFAFHPFLLDFIPSLSNLFGTKDLILCNEIIKASKSLNTTESYLTTLCKRYTWSLAECVDLAPGLNGVLYFEHKKYAFQKFQKVLKKCVHIENDSVQITYPKYVIFNSIQKRENYRSKFVNSTRQILSDFVLFM